MSIPEGRPVLKMRWERLLFLHWAWDPEEIRASLPQGLEPDIYDGKAWLAVVPFCMRKVHPVGLFPVPWLSNFLELNVRTYVRGPGGVPGVWFYSLACNQPIAVALARTLFGLNYVNAKMSADGKSGFFSTRARSQKEARFCYKPVFSGGAGAEAGSLEEFLVERYLLFSTKGKNLFAGRVRHAPYRLASPEIAEWSFVPAEEDGFPNPGRPPDHVTAAEPVNVEAHPIRRVG